MYQELTKKMKPLRNCTLILANNSIRPRFSTTLQTNKQISEFTTKRRSNPIVGSLFLDNLKLNNSYVASNNFSIYRQAASEKF